LQLSHQGYSTIIILSIVLSFETAGYIIALLAYSLKVRQNNEGKTTLKLRKALFKGRCFKRMARSREEYEEYKRKKYELNIP
jgi:hypothetical protein